MQRIAKFYKVSYEQFLKDYKEEYPATANSKIKQLYEEIKLPKRATTGSAGYDFYLPKDITLAPGRTVKIPTGIRVEMGGELGVKMLSQKQFGI